MQGGAIDVVGTLLVENTTFANNTTPFEDGGAGGAIYFWSNANGTLTGCTFIAGKNKSKAGDNDVAREDATSNVLFAWFPPEEQGRAWGIMSTAGV